MIESMKECRQPQGPKPRQVAILFYEGVQARVTGPLEVFTVACELIAAEGRHAPAYEVHVRS